MSEVDPELRIVGFLCNWCSYVEQILQGVAQTAHRPENYQGPPFGPCGSTFYY